MGPFMPHWGLHSLSVTGSVSYPQPRMRQLVLVLLLLANRGVGAGQPQLSEFELMARAADQILSPASGPPPEASSPAERDFAHYAHIQAHRRIQPARHAKHASLLKSNGIALGRIATDLDNEMGLLHVLYSVPLSELTPVMRSVDEVERLGQWVRRQQAVDRDLALAALKGSQLVERVRLLHKSCAESPAGGDISVGWECASQKEKYAQTLHWAKRVGHLLELKLAQMDAEHRLCVEQRRKLFEGRWEYDGRKLGPGLQTYFSRVFGKFKGNAQQEERHLTQNRKSPFAKKAVDLQAGIGQFAAILSQLAEQS